MHENVARRSANGFSDADFVITLGDRDKHDIHDADTANYERDTGYYGQHAGNNSKEIASWVGDLVAIGDGEIGIALFGFGEGVFDVARDSGEAVGISDFDVDLLDLGRAGNLV